MTNLCLPMIVFMNSAVFSIHFKRFSDELDEALGEPGFVIAMLLAIPVAYVLIMMIFKQTDKTVAKIEDEQKKPLETGTGTLLNIKENQKEKSSTMVFEFNWKYYMFELNDKSRITLKAPNEKVFNVLEGENCIFTHRGELLETLEVMKSDAGLNMETGVGKENA